MSHSQFALVDVTVKSVSLVNNLSLAALFDLLTTKKRYEGYMLPSPLKSLTEVMGFLHHFLNPPLTCLGPCE